MTLENVTIKVPSMANFTAAIPQIAETKIVQACIVAASIKASTLENAQVNYGS